MSKSYSCEKNWQLTKIFVIVIFLISIKIPTSKKIFFILSIVKKNLNWQIFYICQTFSNPILIQPKFQKNLILFSYLISCSERAESGWIFVHEWDETSDDGGDGPRRVPSVRMEVGDGKAEAGVGLETAGRGDHVDGWRAEREIGREHELAMVVTAWKFDVLVQ